MASRLKASIGQGTLKPSTDLRGGQQRAQSGQRWFRKAGVRAQGNTLALIVFKTLYVLRVFAEGRVRSTVLDAVKCGYTVHVIAKAVANNVTLKKRFAMRAMKRVGAKIVPTFNTQCRQNEN